MNDTLKLKTKAVFFSTYFTFKYFLSSVCRYIWIKFNNCGLFDNHKGFYPINTEQKHDFLNEF